MATSVEELTGIVGALRISAAPDFPRPHVGVVGAVHGNEPCGLRAIERLRAELVGGELSLRSGTLFLIHGNPRATPAARVQKSEFLKVGGTVVDVCGGRPCFAAPYTGP